MQYGAGTRAYAVLVDTIRFDRSDDSVIGRVIARIVPRNKYSEDAGYVFDSGEPSLFISANQIYVEDTVSQLMLSRAFLFPPRSDLPLTLQMATNSPPKYVQPLDCMLHVSIVCQKMMLRSNYSTYLNAS